MTLADMSVDRYIRFGGPEDYTIIRGIYNCQYPSIGAFSKQVGSSNLLIK